MEKKVGLSQRYYPDVGSKHVRFTTGNLSSGLYFIKINSENNTINKKVVLLK